MADIIHQLYSLRFSLVSIMQRVRLAIVVAFVSAFFGACNVFAFQDEPLLYGKFPDNFTWGLATSAFQIEGGWNEDGKVRHIFNVTGKRWSGQGNMISFMYK
jgi:hypothetical protein